MCGVLGILGAINLLTAKNVLQLLVHRGQDASGLAWVDEYHVHKMAKVKGAPITIPVTDNIVEMVIGSTRYPTSGDRLGGVAKEKFAQPFAFQTDFGTLSICHNGNITNIKELSDKYYHSDAEFITETLGTYINETHDLSTALTKLYETLDGSYSLVGILKDDIFCFRDSRGIRPLIFGSSADHFVFASESICLQQTGMQEISDVLPGEYIRIHQNEIKRQQLIVPQNVAHCFFEYVYFASSASVIDSRSVYRVRLNLGAQLGQELLTKGIAADYIVPVPDTSKSACETISEVLHIPLREAIMKNRSSQRTFIMPVKDARELAARSKYLFIDEFIIGKKLLIIDDSIVRGLTTKYLVQILRDKGAAEVHVAITCPPQRYACYYGVDFGTDAELIAQHDTPIEYVCEQIGANSLTYLSSDGLLRALDRKDLCTACINGNYPTPYGQQLRLLVESGSIAADSTHYE